MKNSLVLLVFLCCGANGFSQITSPLADFTQPTQYTNGMANDEIFVFCSPDINGNAVTGSLTATPTITGPGYTFDWGLYDSNTYTYIPFQTTNGATSSISNLASGGYNVTITNNAGDTETFLTWGYVSIVDVSISLTLDPVNPGCEPFDVNGTINASGFTYWDPVDPGATPFIIDANTNIEVCFNANHTWVSDLGFVLVGPPGCGNPGVTLTPNPEVVDNNNGCCCNSGNNISNLCFSSGNTNQLDMCSSGTPLGGTYGFYNGTFPGAGGGNYPQGGISALYGCNAVEGGWAIQIYDCIGQDVGALTGVTITFTNGPSQIIYSSGAINSTINDNSCDPGSASIYVVPLTTIINPDPQVVPNSGTLTYQLGLNGNPVSLAQGTNSFTQTVDPIPTFDEWYYLFIQDQLGCSAIDSVMFDFTGYADATINPINPTNQLCTDAAPVQLTSVTNGGNWSGNGTNATGMFSAATAGVGTHTITHTISNPCGDVQTMDITVSNLVVDITTTVSICTADNGTATITPTNGTTPYTYDWQTTPGQNTQTAIDLFPGNYDVTVQDNLGCVTTVQVVVGLDSGDFTISVPSTTDALCNASCDGTATVQPQNGTAPFLYLWNDPSSQITAQATALCAETYNVSALDANGCSATAQVIISEPTALVGNATMDLQSNCNLPDGQASVVANGGTVANDYSYSWNTVPVQNTDVATGLIPGIYTATITDDNQCTVTTNVVITSTPGFTVSISTSTDATCNQGCDGSAELVVSNGAVLPTTYLWSNGQTTTTASLLCAENYTVTVTDNVGCQATASVTISEPTVVITQPAVGTTSICIGQSSNLTSGASGGTPSYTGYQWTAVPADGSLTNVQNPTVSPVVSTVYSVIATDANGCVSVVKDISVDVLAPLSLNIIRPTTVDTGICPYDLATIDIQAIGGDGNYTYSLLPDNIPIALPITVQPSVTTSYNFGVTDGCTTPPAFATSVITIFPLPQVDFIGDELTGCDPHTVAFTDLTVPTPSAWNWNFGDSASLSNTASVQNPSHLFSDSGFYDISLTVISADGCVNDTQKEEYIQVFPMPHANFGANPKRTTILNQVTFSDLSTGEIDTWNWDFGTGDGSEQPNPIYLYTDTGTYIVQLNVITVDNCEAKVTDKIIIDPEYQLYVPNSFTPNNDGDNEVFRAYGEGVDWSTYQMFIHNRWGEQIFYTADIDTPWKGWYRNKDVEAGVYVWSIQLVDLLGNQHSLQGHVTLLR